MSLNLTNLSAWTDENSDLLPLAILGTDVLAEVSVRTNVSAGTIALNIFSADTTDAERACGWNPSGDLTYDQVDVTVSDRQIKQEMCVPDLRAYWLAQRMNPGEAGNEELPFENVVADYYLKGVQKNIEDFIGGKIKTDLTAGAATSAAPAAITVSNAVEQLNNIYDALDPAMQMRDDIRLIMSPSAYRTAVRAFVAADLIHYNFNDGTQDIYLPGTSAKLIKSSGLVGSDFVGAFSSENVIFATGLESDSDTFGLFYDRSADNVKATLFFIEEV